MNQRLYRLGTGHIISASLYVVLQLEIADRLLSGAARVDDLAAAAGVHADALYRVMRMLAAEGVFDEQETRVFALTADGRELAKGSGTYRDMGLWITNPLLFRAYAEMMHAVQTGDPAIKKVTGKTVFENVAADPVLAAIFNNAMSSFSASVAPAAMKVYDFGGIRTLVDVGGGHGQVLTTILRAHPAMRGILFELPHVIASAAPVVAASGVADRCRLGDPVRIRAAARQRTRLRQADGCADAGDAGRARADRSGTRRAVFEDRIRVDPNRAD